MGYLPSSSRLGQDDPKIFTLSYEAMFNRLAALSRANADGHDTDRRDDSVERHCYEDIIRTSSDKSDGGIRLEFDDIPACPASSVTDASQPGSGASSYSALLADSVPEPRVEPNPGRAWRPVQPPTLARTPGPLGTSSILMSPPQLARQGLAQAAGQALMYVPPSRRVREMCAVQSLEAPSLERPASADFPNLDPYADISQQYFKRRQNCCVSSDVVTRNPRRAPGVHSPQLVCPLGQMGCGAQQNMHQPTVTDKGLSVALSSRVRGIPPYSTRRGFQPSRMAQGLSHGRQVSETRAPLGDQPGAMNKQSTATPPRRTYTFGLNFQNRQVRSRHSQSSSGAAFTTLPIARMLSGTYQGDPNLPSNQSSNVAQECSCSLWIENLPGDLSYPELFRNIRDVGRVFASVINPPTGQHLTSAVKLVFFDVESTDRFLGKYGGGRWSRLAAGRHSDGRNDVGCFNGPAFRRSCGTSGNRSTQNHTFRNWRRMHAMREDGSTQSTTSLPQDLQTQTGSHQLPAPIPGGLVVRGHKAHIVRNKIRAASSARTPYHTRVLLIHGSAKIVTVDKLRGIFAAKFNFQEDVVIDHGVRKMATSKAATDHNGNLLTDDHGDIAMETVERDERMVEFRFGSFRCQAEWAWKIVKTEMAEYGVGVMYGRDLCDRFVEGAAGAGEDADEELRAVTWEGPRGKGCVGFGAWKGCFRGCGCGERAGPIGC